MKDTVKKCSVEASIDVFGGKWKSIILWHLLMDAPIRFNELQRRVNGVTQRMLTKQLRDLEESELVHREVYPEVPPKVEYSLTKTGKTLGPILHSLRDWGDKYANSILENKKS